MTHDEAFELQVLADAWAKPAGEAELRHLTDMTYAMRRGEAIAWMRRQCADVLRGHLDRFKVED